MSHWPGKGQDLYDLRTIAVLHRITYQAARTRARRGVLIAVACDVKTRAQLFAVSACGPDGR